MPPPRRFFIFWLILLLTHFMAVTLFRCIGHVTRSIVVANACGSLALLAMMMLGGFVLTKSQIHPWWVPVHVLCVCLSASSHMPCCEPCRVVEALCCL